MTRGIMPYCAQTSHQLFAQLRAAGYSATELSLVRAAYDLATPLVSGVYTPCGKPLLEHLVGTASLSAEFGRPTGVVVAMLLHAVYPCGDFGVRGIRMAARRAEVAAIVGPAIESQISAYTALRWNHRTRPALSARLEALIGYEREAVLMRLVNTLELHFDLSALYCATADAQRAGVARQGGLMVEMAARLGVPALAGALAEAFADLQAATVPEELRYRANQTRNHFVRPLSYRRSIPAAVATALGHLRDRLTGDPDA